MLICASVPAFAQQADYQNLLNMCKACHGETGESQFSSIPSLKYQNADYLSTQLAAFKSGQRPDKTMSKVAALLSEKDMQQMAKYFSEGKGK
ncbi:cytochrome C [Shewanella submarina]|uniref:C-type cytochrome n=1 Tax=Shewanella submarina TaxID=2016376 RepID=A0ABV7GD07_9GAMM|nr:cytochrome C [Shewanella submarina]MCL1039165.1 cytochrome C [Shewanella submarina]